MVWNLNVLNYVREYVEKIAGRFTYILHAEHGQYGVFSELGIYVYSEPL